MSESEEENSPCYKTSRFADGTLKIADDQMDVVEDLLDAATTGELYCVKHYIQFHSIDEVNENDETALMLAVKNRHLEIVEYLISQNANVDLNDRHGKNAIMSAASRGHLDILEFLLQNNIELINNLDMRLTQYTALHYAVEENQFGSVLLLMSFGANDTIINKLGLTPLELAIKLKKSDKIIKFLSKNK